ncbi:bifunctional ornithine acetyltransferase/N-acetylglutamate synthase, partial [Methylobacterium sp.]
MSSAKAPPVSPLAPTAMPDLPPLPGVRIATAQAGIRYSGRTDVLYVALESGTRAAGVFTRSKCPSAPVDWCRDALADGSARALVVNSGNANAFTGRLGRDAVARTVEIAAAAAGCTAREVYVASTGVIGEPLPAERFAGVLADCAARAEDGPAAWTAAARAIMTTDTFPKLATRTAEIDGVRVTINGIAKGAGMIAPDMATMLSFVFTDAALPQDVLQ